jgi:hypothetical protein
MQWEWSMQQSGGYKAAPRKAVVGIAAALLGAAVLCQPNLSLGAHGRGGGFLGSGFRGRAVGLHNGFGGYYGGRWYHGWHNRRYGWWVVGRGLSYYSYPWWGAYPGDWSYEAMQPSNAQTWYYCSDPAGYYPYVTQCNTGWQAVPAS